MSMNHLFLYSATTNKRELRCAMRDQRGQRVRAAATCVDERPALKEKSLLVAFVGSAQIAVDDCTRDQ